MEPTRFDMAGPMIVLHSDRSLRRDTVGSSNGRLRIFPFRPTSRQRRCKTFECRDTAQAVSSSASQLVSTIDGQKEWEFGGAYRSAFVRWFLTIALGLLRACLASVKP